ncbi:MAG: EamA family transporter [Anaerolineae bacterium]|nr:EamA family transporter [Anaerolineae bacterium]
MATQSAHSTVRPPFWMVALALLTLYITWGSSYLAMRFAIETFPPFMMAGIRFTIAGAILYLWQASRGELRLKQAHWQSAFILGALMLLGANGGNSWALQLIPSGLVALLVASTPLWTTLLNWVGFAKVRPPGPVIFGLVVGFAGLGLLISPSEFVGYGSINPLGVAVVLIAAASWATGSLFSIRMPLPESRILVTAMEMIAGGVLLLTVSWLTGEFPRFHFEALTPRAIGIMTYLVFVAAVALPCYVWLIKVVPPAIATTYAYVNPVLAVILGWAIGGEPLTPQIAIAGAIILAAVVVITVTPQRQPISATAGNPSKSATTTDAPLAPSADDPSVH